MTQVCVCVCVLQRVNEITYLMADTLQCFPFLHHSFRLPHDLIRYFDDKLQLLKQHRSRAANRSTLVVYIELEETERHQREDRDMHWYTKKTASRLYHLAPFCHPVVWAGYWMLISCTQTMTQTLNTYYQRSRYMSLCVLCLLTLFHDFSVGFSFGFVSLLQCCELFPSIHL